MDQNKFKVNEVNQVTKQQNGSSTLKITENIPPERVIIAENLKKYHQTEGACPLLNDPRLYLDIGAFGEGQQVEYILDNTYVCPENTNSSVKNYWDTYNDRQLFQKRNPDPDGSGYLQRILEIFNENTF